MTTFETRRADQSGQFLGGLPGGQSYVRVQPRIYGPVLGWITELCKPRLSEIVRPKDCNVYKFRNATSFFTVFFDESGYLIEESLLNRNNEKSFLHLTRISDNKFTVEEGFPKAVGTVRAGTWVFLPTNWDVNYGHWLVEVLPRLSAIREVVDLSSVHFIINAHGGAMRRVCVDTLRLFGVKEQQVVPLSGNLEFYENLIFATPITEQPWSKAPLAIRCLENLRNKVDQTKGGPNKIFIDRDSQSRRHLINKDEAAELFLKNGYVSIKPGNMTFEEQVLAFRNATHVAGVLGAECTNIVFSKRGVKFLGLAPEAMQDDFFWDLVSHKDGAYFCLHGHVEGEPISMNSPFRIDKDLLAKVFIAFDAA